MIIIITQPEETEAQETRARETGRTRREILRDAILDVRDELERSIREDARVDREIVDALEAIDALKAKL